MKGELLPQEKSRIYNSVSNNTRMLSRCVNKNWSSALLISCCSYVCCVAYTRRNMFHYIREQTPPLQPVETCLKSFPEIKIPQRGSEAHYCGVKILEIKVREGTQMIFEAKIHGRKYVSQFYVQLLLMM